MPRGERGQIFVMAALIALIMLAMTGLALDVGRVFVMRAKLSRAVDAASLAGVQDLPNESQARQRAIDYVALNEAGSTASVTVNASENQVHVEATKPVQMYFLSLIGIGSYTVRAEATAGFGVNPIDVYLAIDATGSMGDSPCNAPQNNGGCPIKEAKDAASRFVDVLLPNPPAQAQYTKVGVGPFRGCYNPPRTLAGCVPPGSMVADLSNNKGNINGKITSIQAEGGTGTNVCWGLLYAQSILTGANANPSAATARFAVLLSDGDNNYWNSAVYSSSQGSPPSECRPDTNPSNGDPSLGCSTPQTREKELDLKTLAVARDMKTRGIEIYVVGFGVCGSVSSAACDSGMVGSSTHDNTADRNLLKCIASSSGATNDHYIEVATATDLPQVFAQIAQRIATRLVE